MQSLKSIKASKVRSQKDCVLWVITASGNDKKIHYMCIFHMLKLKNTGPHYTCPWMGHMWSSQSFMMLIAQHNALNVNISHIAFQKYVIMIRVSLHDTLLFMTLKAHYLKWKNQACYGRWQPYHLTVHGKVVPDFELSFTETRSSAIHTISILPYQ